MHQVNLPSLRHTKDEIGHTSSSSEFNALWFIGLRHPQSCWRPSALDMYMYTHLASGARGDAYRLLRREGCGLIGELIREALTSLSYR